MLSYFLVFFFFKQKTAYEMRISDWSSDVCSSDLVQQFDRSDPYRFAGAVLMTIDLAMIRAIDVHVHADVSCHDPEDPVMGRFFDAASAYFKAPRERPKIPGIIEIYREQQIAFCLFTVACESGLGARRVSHRSEEHTSELQSLMRI